MEWTRLKDYLPFFEGRQLLQTGNWLPWSGILSENQGYPWRKKSSQKQSSSMAELFPLLFNMADFFPWKAHYVRSKMLLQYTTIFQISNSQHFIEHFMHTVKTLHDQTPRSAASDLGLHCQCPISMAVIWWQSYFPWRCVHFLFKRRLHVRFLMHSLSEPNAYKSA